MSTRKALYLHPGVKGWSCQWGDGVFTNEIMKAGGIVEECRHPRYFRHTRGIRPCAAVQFVVPDGQMTETVAQGAVHTEGSREDRVELGGPAS
ncbi:hypothetical protein HUA76_39060 [Myxococcus sp. CA056]|uniref:hypothetical protein n=1 Tax=Myxococcus sp. CA056 TaxID=2741740 RepID=UPI00157B1B6A|nr:hypothetical protein [Myxococcus sp. CA056]NTX16792.1 hypothetical protein [Myxococcus sp. CA056]